MNEKLFIAVVVLVAIVFAVGYFVIKKLRSEEIL